MSAVVPMESSPEVFNHVAHLLGLESSHGFVDIYSVDDPDLLAMVPRPVSAVILLFPITDTVGDTGADADASAATGAQTVTGSGGDVDVVWFKQTIKNACGLYAVLHSLSNNSELLSGDSVMQQFLHRGATQRPRIYNDAETDQFVTEVSQRYKETFTMGGTQYPADVDPSSIDVNLHFITFVVRDSHVFQLDGRMTGPIDLGAVDTSATDVLDQPLVKAKIRELMDRASGSTDSLNFSMLGLTDTWD
ncbi:Ubiquitin carboxyl-terminal hydrolase YUH1 [Nakaseomyces bracarensis]|uniref:Ubiquitin carboxyl-terminal hydrolase n=1 Tax=Nakaseomyces bracarensis TaxID=273131 RepID=A0ABR4NQ40_9SACH